MRPDRQSERRLMVYLIMLAIFTTAMIVVGIVNASAREKFPHLTCPVVRAIVAEHGEARALAYAIQNGATWKQIKDARACLLKKG